MGGRLNGWTLYFPDKAEEGSPEAVLVRHLAERLALIVTPESVEGNRSIPLDYAALLSRVDDDAFGKLLTQEPSIAIACLACALHQILRANDDDNGDDDDNDDDERQPQPQKRIEVRLYGLTPQTSLRSLRSSSVGRLVSVRGTVIRTGFIRPLVTELSFVCKRCGAPTPRRTPLADGRYRTPAGLVCGVCRGKVFGPARSDASTTDFQVIRLQEELEGDRAENSGRVPRTVDCELVGDLVDTCAPGDQVTVCGVVKMKLAEEGAAAAAGRGGGGGGGGGRGGRGGGAAGGGGAGAANAMLGVYIDVNSLDNSKQVETGTRETIDFSEKDLFAIDYIHEQPRLFQLIVGSVCPAIFGHDLVKAGLALALFGGCQKFAGDKGRIPVRGDSHILVVGDPGMGKSQMLQAVNATSPRGVYVCGTYASSRGLTVSLNREAGSSDFALEAGALVLGDQGVCCLDEFDKMDTSEHQALLEAMEQQSISIAKAGVVCSLPARTSVIAAANPVGGHYSRGKTISENLHMPPALLSRFDLIFILIDKPDEAKDRLLSEHIMALHRDAIVGKKKHSQQQRVSDSQQSSQQQQQQQRVDPSSPEALEQRLRDKGDDFEPLPPQLLRKYIGYARKYVNPKLTSGARSMLKKFYLELREKHRGDDTTPVTNRQLESLIRLTEARAKAELRVEASSSDARDAIAIMRGAIGAGLDGPACIDFRQVQTPGSGVRSSKARLASQFVSILTTEATKRGSPLFSFKELATISRDKGFAGIIGDFSDFVDMLNLQGFLLKSAGGNFKLATFS